MRRWWIGFRRRRGQGVAMGISRSRPPMRPVPHLPELDEFRGKWVAVKNGEVIAVASSSKDLAYELRWRNIQGAVAQYVAEPEEGLRVGLG